MRSDEERIRLMHRKASGLQRERDRRRLFSAGSVSVVLSAVLFGLTVHFQGLSGGYNSLFSGASLLSESAGGYVLVAVIFFMLGVLTTAVIKRHQIRKRREEETEAYKSHLPLSEEGRKAESGFGKKE